jgi:hypothetical protein
MIENTYIANTIDRAFDGWVEILGIADKGDDPSNPPVIVRDGKIVQGKIEKKKKKCCGGSKCKSSGFVPDKTKEK